MASIAPSAWTPPPTTSVAAPSFSRISHKPALVLSLKHLKGRRPGGALVVRTSPAEPPERTTPDEEPAATERVKLALARAKAYKKDGSFTAAPEGNTGGGSVLSVAGGAASAEVAEAGLERSKEYASSQGSPAAAEPVGVPDGNGGGESPGTTPEAVKLAVERAREYEANKGGVEEPGGASEESGNVAPAVPDSVKLAMEKARKYKKNKGVVGGNGDVAQAEPRNTGLEKMKVGSPESTVMENKVQNRGELKISSIDFVGFEFSEKKKREVPARLVPIVDNFSDGDLPEVEIIVGDASKFGSSAPSKFNSNEVDEDSGLYKPRVSTWGVFPRPSNISKTFGGGRNIRRGEVLESADTKAAKKEHTRQMIANYKNQIGLTVDAKLKAECEKALEEGDHLMDTGKLREALPYYEKIMKKLAFQSELHGIAALQWSICQDSLRRPDEARVMYERLQSHPTIKVSKKARQFMFGFQAIQMMNVSSYSVSKTTGYEDYFDAFVEDNVNYAPRAAEQDEGALLQALPYMILLVSPVFFVLVIAIRKSFNF